MTEPTRMVEPSYKSTVGDAELAELRVEDVARRAEDADPDAFVGEEADAPTDTGTPAGVVDVDAAPELGEDEPER